VFFCVLVVIFVIFGNCRARLWLSPGTGAILSWFLASAL